MRAAVEINQAAAAANELTISATLPDTPLVASVDAPRFMRVLVNLIANALKFTPPDGSIAVTAARVDGDIELSVADTGSGIPPEQLGSIFERFQQGANARGRGRGLGLYIARAIVEAHGGRIWAENERGATFRVRLPATT